ncbi:uncharacterized protein LOC113512072 [Galleria mellonella]|uniref:Uncharacterized protein LOC113512072 n=1 Tax=Galleria mellonella TaxID=7137 RepID=A0A6J1WDH0_GALME|nr:uncharacterized protein LOC113512072 [Galleria mellonella]
MTEKLKDYQVLDVLCGGTFYKVKHKVTGNIFAWKAYNCSAYSDEQIQNIFIEVKIIKKVISESLLRYYNAILHGPSKTLYFVLEYTSWRSVQELIQLCESTNKHIVESFIWRLLFELGRIYKQIENLQFTVLQKCITTESIFVSESGELRVNCFGLDTGVKEDVMRQVGVVLYSLCYRPGSTEHQIKEFHYSDDLRDVVSLLTDDRSVNLRPDVVLYHPTVLANIDTLSGPMVLNDILEPADYTHISSDSNKCDSQKAVDLCRPVKPLPRKHLKIIDSPIYSNIIPRKKHEQELEATKSDRGSLSPTLKALALELPGFVPRSRRPYSSVLDKYNCPQQVSEETLSQQWMSRLVALRHREESLNKRERELIAKEIVNSPAAKVVPNDDSRVACEGESNGITLPPLMTQMCVERNMFSSRRRQRRLSSSRSRPRRKSYAYEELDSSLSADPGDGSFIITATRFTKENMPRRNIFPEVSTKKVHFTSANPFTESDESVTLTFYDLENMNSEGYQVPRQQEGCKDITKFKYLDPEKLMTEKRAAVNWTHSSPSKQAKMTKNIFSDMTNMSQSSIRKTPSKSSLVSKSSNTSRCSVLSSKSQWSMDSSCGKVSDCIADRTRSNTRQSLTQTPTVPLDVKKSKSRKSLLPFKTPFKFKTSTKV